MEWCQCVLTDSDRVVFQDLWSGVDVCWLCRVSGPMECFQCVFAMLCFTAYGVV